jgi:hypothetical protein
MSHNGFFIAIHRTTAPLQSMYLSRHPPSQTFLWGSCTVGQLIREGNLVPPEGLTRRSMINSQWSQSRCFVLS